MNWLVSPLATDGAAGVTAIETSVAALTVSVVDPLTPVYVAEIDAEPRFPALARPCEPIALLIVTFVLSLEAQVAVAVRFCVDASV